MRTPEAYWSRKGPPIPDESDLPEGTFKSSGRGFDSLSPGMRRQIWRDAVIREAQARGLPDDTISRLKVVTIYGSLASLDEYLMVFERQDAARTVLPEDTARIQRSDQMAKKSEVQINARETI